MSEFWEQSFQNREAMWGFQPVGVAIDAAKLFRKNDIKKVLIPGIGYGRNAQPFIDNGCIVTGIEVSETAISIASKYFGESIRIHHGPVGDMPFDEEYYEGVFCYALLHLLDQKERVKLIHDCYNQLNPGGYMVFVTLSDKDFRFGDGDQLSKNRFKTKHSVKLFFYDSASLQAEFSKYGLLDAMEIDEPAGAANDKPTQKFWYIVCKKA